MEKLTDQLKLADLRKESIRETFGQAHAQASSILLFTLQWKDLENRFDFLKDSLLKQAQELALKEEKLAESTKLLEQRDQEVEIKLSRAEKGLDELQRKEKQLGLFNKWVEECALELSLKEKELSLVRKEVDGCNGMLKMKREQLGVVQKELQKCNEELTVKKNKLDMVQKSLEEHNGELKSKEMKLGSLNTKLEECSTELSMKNDQLGLVHLSFHECSKELEVKEEEVEKAKNLVANCNDELKLTQKELPSVINLIHDRSGELESKESQLEMLRDLTEKCSDDLASKKSKLSGIEESIDRCLKELDLKKKELNATQTMMMEFLKDIKLREKELSSVQRLIEERSIDVDLKQKHLDSIRLLIAEHAEELKAKEKQHDVMKKSIDECSAELSLKETKLELTEMSILHLQEKELKVRKLIEEGSKELDLKGEHLESIKLLIGENNEELEEKEQQYDAIKKSINECAAKLSLKEEELELIEDSIRTYSKKLKSKEKELNSIKKRLKSYYEDLELKDREYSAVRECIRDRTEELQSKEELLKSVQTSISEYSMELEALKIQKICVQESVAECCEELFSVQGSLRECLDKLALKEVELNSIKRTCESSKELEERGKYFDSLKRTLEERSDKLEMKERQLEESIKEFQLKEKQLDSLQKSVEDRRKQVDLKERLLNSSSTSQTRIEQPGNFMAENTVNSLTVGLQRCTTVNGRNLQLFLNEHLLKHDLAVSEVFTAIQKSPDPGKLVLDAMQGFYPSALEKGDMQLDLGVIRRSCTTLLEQLLKLSPKIGPQLREEAMKLAYEWKSKMRAEPENNSLEVLGFLQLLAAFKLASSFSSDELQSLLNTVSWQAPELQKAFRVPENSLDTVSRDEQLPKLLEARQASEDVPGSLITLSQVKVERIEHLSDSDQAYYSSAYCQHGTATNERDSSSVLDEDMGGHDLNPHEVLHALKISLDPAKFVLDVMQGSYAHQSRDECAKRDASIVRSKIVILEQLMKVSPKISHLVKEEAIKLAESWKANIPMDSENSMEVWAFLLFLLIYGLAFHFGKDEVFRLLVIVAHHRQAPEICGVLGFHDKIPGIIEGLIQRKQHIAAVRFSCGFELTEKFPPGQILTEYIEDTWKRALIYKHQKDWQNKAIDEGLCALRSIVECPAECKFESRFLTQNINSLIAELEKQKAASGVRTSPAPAGTVQPQPDGQNHQSGPGDNRSPAPAMRRQPLNQNVREGVQLQFNNNKRPRIDRPCFSNVATQSTKK